MADEKFHRFMIPLSPSLLHDGISEPAKWCEEPLVAKLLSLLPPNERASTLKYIRTADRARALASRLIKHLAVVKFCDIPWSSSTISVHPVTGKPFFRSQQDGKALELNVSHDENVVIIVASQQDGTQVGIDVMNVNRKRDQDVWKREGGWHNWVKVYSAALSDGEMQTLKDYEPKDCKSPDEETRQKLRLFYTYWVLKEAYIKMDGEAFLADWIKDLEFRGVQAPAPGDAGPANGDCGEWGVPTRALSIWLKGKQVTDVYAELQSLGPDYIVATCISGSSLEFLQDVILVDPIRDVASQFGTWTNG
ncbi:hypothetical protein MMC25_005387 [Agyrium rufum]|nr:hypothetical protein [Agyrium rufum]